MLKRIIIISMVLFCTFFVFSPVSVEAHSGEIIYSLDEVSDCNSLFGDPKDPDKQDIAYFLQQALTIMQYAGPILCLVLSISDFVKAAASQDKDALTKATKTTGKRIIFAMILFFIPVLVNFLFPLLGWYGTCGIQ